MPPKGVRRPAAKIAVRKKPAARQATPKSSGEAEADFRRGQAVDVADLFPGALKQGDWIKSKEAIYYGQPIEFAGYVSSEKLEGGDREIIAELSGTSSHALLAYASENHPPEVRLHVCGKGCSQSRENPNLIHLKKVVLLLPGKEAGWEKNLVIEPSTAMLHQEKAESDLKKKKKEKEKEEEVKSSSSEDKKKSKKKKKKKKEKKKAKEDAEKKEDKESPARVSRLGGRHSAKKELKTVYGNTGLDPSGRRRRKLGKKTRRALKKDRNSSTSSSGSSGTSDHSVEDSGDLLQDRSKIARIARLAPGLLASMGVSTMKEYVMEIGGLGWNEDPEAAIPPVLGAYARHYLVPKTSGGIQREICCLSHIGDLCLQGRVAEAMDVLIQRVKSLEMTASGGNWATSQKLELTKQSDPQISSRSEYAAAKKEARLDSESRPGGGDKGGKGKSKDKGKDKNNKGKGKQKDGDKKS